MPTAIELSDAQRQRYQRQVQLPEFGPAGQKALINARVLIIGLGGLGCPAAQYLAGAGIGHLTLVDGDRISLSNLHRQPLFRESEIGQYKTETAAAHLAQLNSSITIKPITNHLDIASAQTLIPLADLVLDCTDNFFARYLINDLCHHYQKPWIYASVLGFAGQLALFAPSGGCFRCLFPTLSNTPNCNQAGVIGALPGMVGSAQALAAINYLHQRENYANKQPSHGQLRIFSGKDFSSRTITFNPSPDCPMCAHGSHFYKHQQDYRPLANTTQRNLTSADYSAFIKKHKPLLIDVRMPQEHQQFNLGGLNIPLDQLSTDAVMTLAKQQAIVLYCQSGARSDQGLQILTGLGFTEVYALEGGLNALAAGG